MSLRTDISGTFTETDLDRLTWPIAWSGFVAGWERRKEEASLAALVTEAGQEIATTDGAYAVEILNGEIVGVLVEEDEEE
jgi:hypothetical protein